MGIRQSATSFSHRLREQVRSTVLGTGTREDETTLGDRPTTETVSDRVTDSLGNLFHCSRCSVVYIAAEKHTCSECDQEVEQVRSTLACQGP
ncbi:hypothetical protein [Natrinema halophilum]|uniref:Uncharacterized protein n=1 Tax=Natrinema halophilum TaxID=1699371 RepID=A0A7D5KQW7_9EURY|nr:hypothetical protein [Natrinema halophilum]QLG48777.1 hypothetical protein HYG82_07920 [Natrinema halophilum]